MFTLGFRTRRCALKCLSLCFIIIVAICFIKQFSHGLAVRCVCKAVDAGAHVLCVSIDLLHC